MSIIRTKRPEQFTIISNSIIEDMRLNWQDMAILIYLLSKPDNWEVSPSHLMTLRNLKRDAIYKSLNNLCDIGYATKAPNPKGGWDWNIYDKPNTENTEAANNAESVKTRIRKNPHTEKTTQVNTDNKTKTDCLTTTATTREQEKTVVVAKSEKPDLEIIDSHNKPTPEQINSTQKHLDRFVDKTPLPENPNDIVFSEYELGCFQWAVNHSFWHEFTDTKTVFLKTLNKLNGNMKPQYDKWLRNQQAQKSPVIATNNQQGLQTLNQNTGSHYVTPRYKNQECPADVVYRESLARIERKEREEALRQQDNDAVVATYDSHLQPQVDFGNGLIRH